MIDQARTLSGIQQLFHLSVDDIAQQADRCIAQLRSDIDVIIAVKDEDRTFANTPGAFDKLSLSDFYITIYIFHSLESVSPIREIRDAVHSAIVQMNNVAIDLISSNKLLYQAIKQYAQHNAKKEALSKQQQYFLDEVIDDFERSGLALPDKELQAVTELTKEIAAIGLSFDRNIAEDTSTITVLKDDLTGLDDTFIDALEKTETGAYILGTDYPTFLAVMQHCSVGDTRKRLSHIFNNRAYPKNDTVLKEIIAKRDRLARLLGYQSYADLDLADQMAKNVATVEAFLSDLQKKSTKKVGKELAAWLEHKPDSVQLTEDGKLYSWDVAYVISEYKKKELKIDDRIVAQYFPKGKTIQGLFDVYQQFFDISLVSVPIADMWHEDVSCIQVYTKDRSQLLGTILLDLHPREGKYNHACKVLITPTFITEDGAHYPGVVLVITNFPEETEQNPALLTYEDVSTFFHEFGHALHSLLGATSLVSMSGTAVKRDFVELPSQILEEWLYDKEILKMVSSHYQTEDPLPDAMIDGLIALKNVDSGMFVQRQTFLSQLALQYYLKGEQKDLYDIMRGLYNNGITYSEFDVQSHFYASFGHLYGYDAKYYGYLWSKVFALDLFYEIKKHGLLNPSIGRKYIREILSKGGTVDPNELLYNFLGRKPNSDAFFHDMGL